MNKSILCAVMSAALLTVTSCDKEKNNFNISGIASSETICDISLKGTCNNLMAISSKPQSVATPVEANVPVISYADEEYLSGHGFQFIPAVGTSPEQIGNVPYVFHSGGNKEYTVDCGFKLIQSIWNKEQTGYADFWTDYTNYGLIETDINFRIRGEKGERIIDFDDGKNWSPSEHYYLTGVVTDISEVSENTKDFETLPIYKSYFDKIGFQQTVTSYMAQSCVLTIVTETDTLKLEVYGKKRDNELPRLLESVNIGHTIEFPVWVKDKDSLKKRKIEPVKVSTVLTIK